MSYPKENHLLQDNIGHNHLLINQVPFYRYHLDSFRARRYYFLRRNVTMSALSQATVVVEANERSGTLAQARAALAQKRKLFILNSCFENPSLRWPHYYEQQGAIRVKKLDDILKHFR